MEMEIWKFMEMRVRQLNLLIIMNQLTVIF